MKKHMVWGGSDNDDEQLEWIEYIGVKQITSIEVQNYRNNNNFAFSIFLSQSRWYLCVRIYVCNGIDEDMRIVITEAICWRNLRHVYCKVAGCLAYSFPIVYSHQSRVEEITRKIEIDFLIGEKVSKMLKDE